MINKYIFDYRLVLDEDPSFEKFVDIRTIGNPEEHYDRGYRANPFADIKSTDINEEENDIIDFVHSKDDEGVYKRADEYAHIDDYAHNMPFKTDNQKITEVKLKPEYVDMPNANYKASALQLPPPNRFLLPGSKVWQGEHTFYEFTGSNIYDDDNSICLIQKHRFSKKDHFIRLQKTVYRFDRKRNVTSEIKKYLYMWTYNVKTKQLYQIRKQKNSLKKRSHFHSKINNIFNVLTHTNWNSGAPKFISNTFLNEIIEAAKKDVPDLVMLNPADLNSNYPAEKKNDYPFYPAFHHLIHSRPTFQTMGLAATILQHRVGRPLKWLNYNLMENILELLGEKQFQELALNGANGFYNRKNSKDTEKHAKALRKKTIFKLVPNLKKNNHMNEAIKTIVGEHCNKFIIRLFNIGRINIQFLHNWIYAANTGMISKNLYHFMSNTINIGYTKEDISSLLDNITAILVDILHKLHLETNNGQLFDKDNYYLVVDSYLKMYKKIKNDNNQLITWHRWRDMYDMATQLGIRIRPNKLKNGDDVRILHDRLSNIIRRDRITIKKYRNSIFDEFKSPDKKYDGFEFIQMRTAQDLIEEGTIMKHCVASYTNKCAESRSIIFSMRKDGKGYVTIELSPTNYEVVQQYTIQDHTVTNQEVLGIIDRWNKDCLELHKDDEDNYYNMYNKRIQDKVKEENDKNIKELVKEGIIDAEEKILKSMAPCDCKIQEDEEIFNATAI